MGFAIQRGGVLLGLGAFFSRACVLGTVANFGSGSWAYIFTPIGFYVGCISVGAVRSPTPTQKPPYGSPVLQASAWVAPLFVVFVLQRIGRPLVAGARKRKVRELLTQHVWSQHASTMVIGMMFLVMLLLVGRYGSVARPINCTLGSVNQTVLAPATVGPIVMALSAALGVMLANCPIVPSGAMRPIVPPR